MRPAIGLRSGLKEKTLEQMQSASREFVERNIHHNMTLKRKFLYEEDVKTAININALEERIILKRWLIAQLKKGISIQNLLAGITESVEKDRHRLQKKYGIHR